MKLKYEIDAKKVIRGFKRLERELPVAMDLVVEDWLQMFRQTALQIKPWQDQTGNLRAQHKIDKIQQMEWQLSIDTQLGDPEREEYGQVLEGSSKWRWIKPTIGMMESHAGKMAVERLNLITRDL